MPDRVLVYSSETGLVNKSSQPTSKKKKGGKKTSPASAIKNPAKQGVRIQRESKGRGGKSVSVITGLTLDVSALKDLGKKLKAQLGTGGAIKDGNIEIQGDHREKLLDLLEKAGFKAKISGG
jgi:translation initiation factor 1